MDLDLTEGSAIDRFGGEQRKGAIERRHETEGAEFADPEIAVQIATTERFREVPIDPI